jgi:hypothetical protein
MVVVGGGGSASAGAPPVPCPLDRRRTSRITHLASRIPRTAPHPQRPYVVHTAFLYTYRYIDPACRPRPRPRPSPRRREGRVRQMRLIAIPVRCVGPLLQSCSPVAQAPA